MKTPVGLSFLLASSLAAAPAAAQVCGDYARDPLEQCDDGNARNLDGCDATCRFEQTLRINDFRLQGAVGTVCTGNLFGGAFTALGLFGTNTGIATTVNSGATSILFHVLGLDDPAGVSDGSIQVGVLSGLPVLPGSTAYSGATSSDWWYAVEKTMIDAQRQPLNTLAGGIAGSELNVGPGAARLQMILSGGPASFSVTNMSLRVGIGASTVPPSSSGLPPGHLAVEHVDPALATFASAGSGPPNLGTMCADVSALSMKLTPVPPPLRAGVPTTGCAENYTAANSLLDVFIGGCSGTAVGVAVTAGNQPDRDDPSAPAAGAGGPYELIADPVTKIVTSCEDSTNVVVDLTACLTDAAYSSRWGFTAHRVIAGDNRILRDSFETGDMSAWSAANTDGGDLTVDPSAAMNGGTQGLLGNINDTTGLFVEDQLPEDENRYRASFWFDPTGFDPGEINNKRRTRTFIAFEDGPRRLAAIVLRRLSGQYAIQGRARQDDNSQANTPFFDITPGPHRVEFDWIRSSGPDANDGRFVLSIDGTVVSTLPALDNSISSVDFARLGALSVKVGANGTLKWDHFESNRMSATAP